MESIATFNQDKIPFYLSVPAADSKLFQSTINFVALNDLDKGAFHLILDEDIVGAMPNSSLDDYYNMRGYWNQQVVKSEAWRFLHCENYLCLDSDAYFTKPFQLKNFMHEDGYPYSLMHDAHELLDLAKNLGQLDVINGFISDSQQLKTEFQREGPDYDFGPPPMIWSAKVWESLYSNYLLPRNMRLWDAIEKIPMEIRWYGEALLNYQAIPIHPIGPIFHFYHYEWQYQFHQNNPTNQINEKIIGEVKQSYWDESLRPDFAKKSWSSRAWKRIKKLLKKG
ncbi:hypothetical protein PSHI8_03000 [Polynucleobacter sp. SHI8]|nr:hypothetical protein PSHI2_03000 [Polynucleobacter sp. SHI2]BDW12664.1 hypothetical protein PSHI8_03000 [Polynucleobacter sp. SHI8]